MVEKGEKLKYLMRKIDISEPTVSYTEEVVKEIEAITKNNVVANDNLKYLLQEHALTTPPTNFTYKILNQARSHSTEPVHKPVISNRTWLIITLIIFALSVEAIVSKPVAGAGDISLYFISFGRYLNTLSLQFFEPLFFLGIIIISASLLLTLDFAFYRMHNSKTNNITS